MKYELEYEVRYQDLDHTRTMRLPRLENYLLETAGRIADCLGFGIKQLQQQGLTWILTSMSIEMKRMPMQNEHIIIETWIENNIHLLSVRNFRIWHQSETGREQIGQCRSVWAVLDLKKREIANVFEQEMFQGCADGEALPISRAARLRPLSTVSGKATNRVNYSDMDYNMHCNSCKYLEKMLNTCLPDFIGTGKNEPIRLEITYTKEVHYKENIEVLYQNTDNGVLYQINNSAGEVSCLCSISRA